MSTPIRVVRGHWVQHNGHKGPDVVNPGGLSVEGGDGVSIKPRSVGA